MIWVWGYKDTWVRSLSQEDPLEEGMATHSSFPAWRIPCTEEPGATPVFLPGEFKGRWSLLGCRSMGSHRVGHN